MTLEEITQLTALQQTILSRHDREMAQFRESLQHSDEQRQQDTEAFNSRIAATQQLANLNQEMLNQLTAGLMELRVLVADYLRGQSSLE